jgi:hypothetical protein
MVMLLVWKQVVAAIDKLLRWKARTSCRASQNKRYGERFRNYPSYAGLQRRSMSLRIPLPRLGRAAVTSRQRPSVRHEAVRQALGKLMCACVACLVLPF